MEVGRHLGYFLSVLGAMTSEKSGNPIAGLGDGNLQWSLYGRNPKKPDKLTYIHNLQVTNAFSKQYRTLINRLSNTLDSQVRCGVC